MVFSGSQHAAFAAGAAQWARRNPLVLALAFSLLLHAVLLSAMRGYREGDSPIPVLLVTLSSAPAPASPQAEPPAPPSPDAKPQPQPVQAAAPAAPAVPASAPRTAERPQEARPANKEITFFAADRLGDAPRPMGRPLISEALAQQLLDRRLQVRVWVDPFGAVRKVVIRTDEVPPAAAAEITDAISRIGFEPAKQLGQPVGSIWDTRICIDARGQLDDSSPECWQLKQQ